MVNGGESYQRLPDEKVLPEAHFLMGDLTRSKELENMEI